MSEHETVRFDDADWVRRMAELEDHCESVSVGGLAVESGLYRARSKEPAESIAREALGKLIAFSRRKMGLTAEEFAERAAIDLAALVLLENAQPVDLDPRTLAQLAAFLSVSASRLADLAGTTRPCDPGLRKAAVRFAARAEPVQSLSEEEQAALRDFVKELAQRPEEGK